MRQILIDRARQKMSLKRGGRPEYVSIDEVDIADEMPGEVYKVQTFLAKS